MEGDRPNRSVGCLQLFQEANSEYGAYASTRHYMSGGTNWYGTCFICRNRQTSFITCPSTSLPLFDSRANGVPYRQNTSSTSVLATVTASLFFRGRHLQNLLHGQTIVRMYTFPCRDRGWGPVSMRLFFSVFTNKISFFLIKVADIAPNFMSVEPL